MKRRSGVLKFSSGEMTWNRTRNIFFALKLLEKGNNSLNISQTVRNSKRKRPKRHFRTRSDLKSLYHNGRTFHAKASANGEKETSYLTASYTWKLCGLSFSSKWIFLCQLKYVKCKVVRWELRFRDFRRWKTLANWVQSKSTTIAVN